MRKFVILFLLLMTTAAYGQDRGAVFTGTALIYSSGFNTRTVTRTFTLRLNGQTSGGEISRLVDVLRDRGQDALLNQLDDEKVGNFSLGGQVARDVNAAYVSRAEDGRTRIRAVFARWLGFGELRGGLRSRDYPFSYIEILIDPRTGRGEGTFIPAARIRFSEKNNQVEIEDFGTFPSRLLGVQMRGRMLG